MKNQNLGSTPSPDSSDPDTVVLRPAAFARKRRVLVIDNEKLVRETLRSLLEVEGCEVEEADDGEAGLAAYGRSPADIVFIDIFMPGKDGIETLREFRREYPDSKLVAISGGGQTGYSEVLRFARNLGADQVLNKPIGRSDISTLLRGMSN